MEWPPEEGSAMERPTRVRLHFEEPLHCRLEHGQAKVSRLRGCGKAGNPFHVRLFTRKHLRWGSGPGEEPRGGFK
jgi:hypothetical protein